jgi:glycosyltransferase involved in cell wall biosynthesis
VLTQGRVELLILESHPVQYHAPVYRELARLRPGKILVVYGSDCSIRGMRDQGFGLDVAWDVPLLEGYPYHILHSQRGETLKGPLSLRGRDVVRLLSDLQPRAVLFNQMAYEMEWAAYLTCVAYRIQIWIRTETQDRAFARTKTKALARTLLYRILYSQINRCFYIGKLNFDHFLAQGVPGRKLFPARYCVLDPWRDVSRDEKRERRERLRARYGISPTEFVVGFFGKLIPKKAPDILLEAWPLLEPSLRRATRILYVGDGELRTAIESTASTRGCPIILAGFVNQKNLPDYYLAADVVVLPSRRMGETWGLVINEALHAGCAVVVSSEVGCHAEFDALSRVRVVPADGVAALASALTELAGYDRDFDWSREYMRRYSVEAAAEGIATGCDTLMSPDLVI